MSEPATITRKLTTILAADAANYSGRMAADEVATVQALRRARAVIDESIKARGGRIANTAGDGLIAEFPSVVEAVQAAITIQRALRGTGDDSESRLPFRLGLHLGDVIVEGADLLGDGVNIAARLQENAPKGGIFVSSQVVDHAKTRIDAEFRPLGPAHLKHLGDAVSVFAIVTDGVAAPDDLTRVLPQVMTRKRPKGDATGTLDLRALVTGGAESAETQAAATAPRETSAKSARKTPEPEAAIAERPQPEVTDQTAEDARVKFRSTARNYGLASGGLLFVDLLAGAGPGWPLIGVAVLGGLLYRKWKALPPQED